MRVATVAIWILAAVVPAAHGAGHAFNENFSVLSPPQSTAAATQRYAEQVLDTAERYRRELALEWFGKELPNGLGRTTINVSFSTDDSALTWAIDNSTRKSHMLYLSMSPGDALGASLKHEMLHVILATRFPHPARLPAWLEEGMASRYDDASRMTYRRELIRSFARTDRWPSLVTVLSSERVSSGDAEVYAIAESVTNFLIARGGKAKLMEFARDLSAGNLTAALHQHYRLDSVDDLAADWQKWAAAQ